MQRCGGRFFERTKPTATIRLFSIRVIDFAIKLLQHDGTDSKVEQPFLRGSGLKKR